MNYEKGKNYIKIYDKEDFNPEHILECGQVFCFEKINDNKYIVFPGEKYAEITNEGNFYLINTEDVDFFEKEEIKFFSVECGASGICALMKLMCNIYRNGYYVEWSKDHEDLFGWDMRGMVPREEIPHIIGVCLKRGIFKFQFYLSSIKRPYHA